MHLSKTQNNNFTPHHWLSKALDQSLNFNQTSVNIFLCSPTRLCLLFMIVPSRRCQTILDTFTSALYYPDKRSGFCNMYAMHALVSFSMCTFRTWWAFKDCQLQPDSGSLFSLFNVSGPYIIANELLIRNAVRRKPLCCVKLLEL